MSAIVARCIETAKQAGARDASARGYRVREVSLEYRDGKVEKISEATRRGVSIELFVDDRYSVVSTSDLRAGCAQDVDRRFHCARKDARTGSVSRAARSGALQGPSDDRSQARRSAIRTSISAEQHDEDREDTARRGARRSRQRVRSCRSHRSRRSTLSENWQMTSNGFSGTNRGTSYSIGAQVSAKDADGRRPEEYDYASSRFWNTLPDAQANRTQRGRADARTTRREKPASAEMTVLVDNRVSGPARQHAARRRCRLVDPAEALVPREQAGPAVVQPACLT